MLQSAMADACVCRLRPRWLSPYSTRSATFCQLAVLPAALTHACAYHPLRLAISWPHLYSSQAQRTRYEYDAGLTPSLIIMLVRRRRTG